LCSCSGCHLPSLPPPKEGTENKREHLHLLLQSIGEVLLPLDLLLLLRISHLPDAESLWLTLSWFLGVVRAARALEEGSDVHALVHWVFGVCCDSCMR